MSDAGLLDELDAYLKAHGITHFSAREIVQLDHPVKGVHNSVPPKILWPNIIPTLEYLEQIRYRLGPLVIHSGYRNTLYNAAVGGKGDSMHQYFNAIDWTPARVIAGLSILDIAEVVQDVCPVVEIGLGVYQKKNFIHLDTRGKTLGRHGASWSE